MSEHTGPYVPKALYPCECGCGVVEPPEELFWDEKWECRRCIDKGRLQARPMTLADHLESLEPRWVPVAERLPEFVSTFPGDENNRHWHGMVLREGYLIDSGYWGKPGPTDTGITHWLDFTPPPLPGEEGV